MSQPDKQGLDTATTRTSTRKAASFTDAAAQKAAVRAAVASTRLEGRELPPDYVRSDGVKTLLAERAARKH